MSSSPSTCNSCVLKIDPAKTSSASGLSGPQRSATWLLFSAYTVTTEKEENGHCSTQAQAPVTLTNVFSALSKPAIDAAAFASSATSSFVKGLPSLTSCSFSVVKANVGTMSNKLEAKATVTSSFSASSLSSAPASTLFPSASSLSKATASNSFPSAYFLSSSTTSTSIINTNTTSAQSSTSLPVSSRPSLEPGVSAAIALLCVSTVVGIVTIITMCVRRNRKRKKIEVPDNKVVHEPESDVSQGQKHDLERVESVYELEGNRSIHETTQVQENHDAHAPGRAEELRSENIAHELMGSTPG